MRPARINAGYSLIELTSVISVMAIVAAVALPMMNPSIVEQLEGVAQVITEDAAYARSLGVVNNSKYRVTIDVTNQLYYLEHSGTNTALNTLPSTANRRANDAATRNTIRLTDLPAARLASLYAVVCGSTVSKTNFQIEFGAFGETTQTLATVIWLAGGTGNLRRYLSVTINPVTGLATIGDLTAIDPTSPASGQSGGGS